MTKIKTSLPRFLSPNHPRPNTNTSRQWKASISSMIDYTHFSRGERCTEEGCRSRKWYIEDGKKFCQRGHEQAGFTQTQQDEDDWNNQGRKVRKKREEKERVQTVLSGRDAQELYLQCYQLILWKQCHWLVNFKGFPQELETVVRDLWGLRLRVLYEDIAVASDGFGSGVSVVGFSEESEGDTGSDATDGRSLWSGRSRRSTAGRKDKLPKLIDTLALCYLGTLLMHLPISVGEIFDWASCGDMLYARAIKEVPKAMRSRLPAHFHYALEIHSPLNGSAICSSVTGLVEFYHLHFEMSFPALNTPLLLIKHMRDLALPIEIYPGVRMLASMLNFDFVYSLSQKKGRRTIPYPEVQLMSLIVVATKLSQPFDNVTRHPASESDPSLVQMNWSQWAQSMAETPSDGMISGEEIYITDANVLGMTKKQMDDYLDAYQRTWIDDRDPKVAEQILELFPLQELPGRRVEDPGQEKITDRLKEIQESSTLRKVESTKDDDHITRMGECYKRFRTVGDLSKEARAFYTAAARNTGIELSKLLRAVLLTEIHLDNWIMAEKKRLLREEFKGLGVNDR